MFLRPSGSKRAKLERRVERTELDDLHGQTVGILHHALVANKKPACTALLHQQGNLVGRCGVIDGHTHGTKQTDGIVDGSVLGTVDPRECHRITGLYTDGFQLRHIHIYQRIHLAA